ncbi:MAG: ExbD/TolR family protein [Myxococcota bacterium]
MAMGRLPEADPESEGIISEINITPLTDIFLVLLIIFMVTSTALVQQALQVNLPQSSSGQAVPQSVTITLTPDEKIFLDGKLIPKRGDLPQRLRAALAETSDQLVILEGDERVLLGQAVELLDRARKAGAKKVAVATKPPEGR